MIRYRHVAVIALAALPVVGGGFLLQSRATRDSARMFDQVLTLISDRFVDTISTPVLYERAARGLVRELSDPYSQLLTPKELRRFTTNTGGRYGGIGMQIEDQQGNITVSRVFPHTPAEQAGVMEGDRIVAVETISTRGWTLSAVSDSLTGDPGTKVHVRFARPGVGDPIDVRFTRSIIHIPAVPYAIMLDGNIAYLPLQQFNETARAELEQSLRRLASEGAQGIVLDLRGNTGGILDQALEVSDLFLPAGTEIASVRGRTGPAQTFIAELRPIVANTPLVILTDGNSASASEIVAGALQDHDRALIVGTTSFGKGLVQTLFPLEGGYALKMTTAKWYTPLGRSIHKERTEEDSSEAPVIETEAVKQDRPQFRSRGGRIVYGGGAITPDVIVSDDTLPTIQQEFVRAIAPHSQSVYIALHNYAMELRGAAGRDFQIRPEWRDELYRRLVAAGVSVERVQYDAAAPWVDRQITMRLTRLAFGDSTAKRRDVQNDAPLGRAIELLRMGRSQEDLFVVAQRQNRE